ncbi:folate-binding protein [Sandarakinorhabdus sp.]|uniref:CAF17-like 4Fe-4S cluster assembly/insertion protein YgfZ n=1 Tax=Sandarakinorhabdus sp. TaxID=1916663 RepID=UPI00286E19E8|nr:folate-binding protein [Sandarakinorhabdus sp.]
MLRTSYLGRMTIVHLQDRAVLEIAGADARSFLQGLVTHDMALLAPGRPLYAGMLSPQGKTLFDMILFAKDSAGDPGGEGAVLIDVAANRAEALAKRLAMYRMRKAVTIAPSPLHVHAGWNGGEAGHTPDPRGAGLGARWLDAGDPAKPHVIPGAESYHLHRLACGVPDSADIGSDDLLWLETGADLLDGVSFTKGCYVGQENTARMHHRDKVRRRLVPLMLTADPGEDADVRDAEGRVAGRLRSHVGMAAMAHLRMETADSPLFVSGAPVSVGRPAWLAAAF